jgi:glycosyltransferase involved in cell wall biosynthesis
VPTLSVIIITKNSEKTIEQCLQSVQFADEIIVLDSGSEDQTLALCQHYTSKVFQTDWPGYGPQKNRALDKATGEWVFSIDSDEWISDESRREIIEAMQNNSADVFMMPRLNQYCGQWIYHGDAGRDKVTRLFKRTAARFSDDIVHESLVTTHTIKKLKHPLMHNTYDSLDALISRMNKYSTLSAQLRFKKGKKSNLRKALTSSIWIFIRSYILRRGFLDGKMGFIVAVSNAECSFYRHLKLSELTLSQKSI